MGQKKQSKLTVELRFILTDINRNSELKTNRMFILVLMR